MFSIALFRRLTIALFLTASLCVIGLYLITVPILKADLLRLQEARHRLILERLEKRIRGDLASAGEGDPLRQAALEVAYPPSRSERLALEVGSCLRHFTGFADGALIVMDEQMRLIGVAGDDRTHFISEYLAPATRETVMTALRRSHENGGAFLELRWRRPGAEEGSGYREEVAWIRYMSDFKWYLLSAGDGRSHLAQAESLGKRITFAFVAVATVLASLLASVMGGCLAPVIPLADMSNEFLRKNRVRHPRFVAAKGELGKIGAAFYKMIVLLETLQEKVASWDLERRDLIRTRDAARIRAFDLSRAKGRLEKQIETFKTEEEQLRKSEDRYRAMLENIDECFYEADLLGNLVFFNDALIRMLDYDKKDDLVGKNFREIMDQETAKEAFQTFDMAMEKGEAFKGLQWRLVRKSGQLCHVEISVSLIRDKNDEIIGYRGVGRDVSRLVYMVYHDTLTGLLNRKAFFEELEKTVRIAKRYKMEAKLLFMDLNQFKLVNDEYGHDVGDEVLKEVARRMVAALRETDMTFRLAGDEFTVILNNMNGEFRPEEVARRIIEQLSLPYLVKDDAINFISPSIGISAYPEDAATVEELIRCADIAMFEAKERSKQDAVDRMRPGRFTFYDSSMEEKFQGNRTWNDSEPEDNPPMDPPGNGDDTAPPDVVA